MNQGFFSISELNTSKPKLRHSNYCGACGLYKHCQNPKMTYKGEGRKKILVVNAFPDKNEKRLQYELKKCGINLNADCWKTNAIRCRPEDNKTPDSKQITHCRPALFAEIKKLQPNSILLFGSVATEAVLGHL